MSKFLLRIAFILISVCFFISGAFAQFVSSERAEEVAVALYNQRRPADTREIATSEIISESLQYFKEVPVYYVFNIAGGSSFAIIAADERIHPVIGYSFESSFDPHNVSDCLDWLLLNYQEQIHDVVSSNLNYKDLEVVAEWQQFESDGMQKSGGPGLPSLMDVTPLTTTTWSQGCYYNEQCPADNTLGTTRCGRVPTGCVATAFGQVLKYHNHPVQGTGSNTYTSNYGPLTANFGATTYNWANMPNKLLASNPDVAQLLFHTGVSINMGYTANSSAAYTTAVRTALVNKFKYSSTAQNVSKSSYTNTQWDNLIRTELDAQRIVIINGHDPAANAGHAFIADGYQGTNSFHINWGWNGSSDGYFLLTALSPSSYAFNSSVGAIIGIKPLVTAVTCAAVNGLSSNSITSTGATLTWAPVSGASNTYNIKYKLTTSSTWTTVTSTTTSKTLTGLTPGTSYHFQVQRVCSGTSSSNYSSSATFTTLASTSSNTTVTVGTGTSTSGAAPYGTSNMDERAQFIITKSQLVTAGYTSTANFIKSLAFNVSTANNKTMNGFTIKVGHTTASSFSSTSFISTTMTTVFSGNVTVTSGWNTHTFTTAFPYNGSSNLLVDICWNNSSTGGNSNVKYSTTSAYQTLYNKTNVLNGGVCSNTTGTKTYSRPNMKFVFSSSALKMSEGEEETEAILEEDASLSLNLYPNPTQSTATIEFNGIVENAQISVFDVTGKQVFADNMNGSSYVLQVENFTPGIYLVIVQNESQYFTKRLMVKQE